MSDSEQEAWQQDGFDGMKAEIAQLRAEKARIILLSNLGVDELRRALRVAFDLIEPQLETTEEPYTEWDAHALVFLNVAKPLLAPASPIGEKK